LLEHNEYEREGLEKISIVTGQPRVDYDGQEEAQENF
jgi:hypothetical protein